MADYYPLLARALDALPDRTPAMRTAVYERARNALVAQLRSLDPPLSDDDVDLERRALDAAIERLEVDYGGPKPGANAAAPAASPPPSSPPAPFQPTPPAPAPPAQVPPAQVPPTQVPPAPAPPPAEPTPPQPEPASAMSLPEPAAPAAMPAAPAPSFQPEPEPSRPAAIPIAPRRAKPPTEPEVAPAVDPDPAADPSAAGEAGGNRQRPRIEVVAPRHGRSRLLRNAIVGVVLALVIGTIAVAAYLLRDQPSTVQTAEEPEAAGQAADGEAKFADRVGGDGQPAERAAPPTAAGETRPQAAPPVQPDLAVAQRALLLEENSSVQNAQPVLTAGRVVWRLESVSGEQGQPLQTAVVATATIPDAGLSLVMTIQRNLDATLPASHTVSLAFTNTGTDGEKRAVQDIGLLQAKDDENGRGSPVSGLPVRVRENLFLIGLSSLRADVERNTDLLLHRNWFDIALRYTSGQRAVVTFEKGTSGTYVMQRAFDQWR